MNQDPVKETTVQSYQKILNQNIKKSLGIEGALFNCTGEMGMDNFGCTYFMGDPFCKNSFSQK